MCCIVKIFLIYNLKFYKIHFRKEGFNFALIIRNVKVFYFRLNKSYEV